MTLPYQKAVTGQPYKNNGGVVLNGGNTDSSVVVSKTPADIASNLGYGTNIVLAVSAAQSGHLGTYKPFSAGTFAYQQLAGDYTSFVIGTKISGVASTRLRSGGTDVSLFRAIPLREGTRRLSITSFSYTTHAATKGGTAGDASSFGTDHAARPTDAVPGELVYQYGGPTPLQDDYKPRTGT
jgi:hypothetical protein